MLGLKLNHVSKRGHRRGTEISRDIIMTQNVSKTWSARLGHFDAFHGIYHSKSLRDVIPLTWTMSYICLNMPILEHSTVWVTSVIYVLRVSIMFKELWYFIWMIGGEILSYLVPVDGRCRWYLDVVCYFVGILLYSCTNVHDDVIKWKHFPRYWPFVRGIHRSSVNSAHKGQWRGALMLSLICALNKRLSKQSRGWWFQTPSRPLWRHSNELFWHLTMIWY